MDGNSFQFFDADLTDLPDVRAQHNVVNLRRVKQQTPHFNQNKRSGNVTARYRSSERNQKPQETVFRKNFDRFDHFMSICARCAFHSIEYDDDDGVLQIFFKNSFVCTTDQLLAGFDRKSQHLRRSFHRLFARTIARLIVCLQNAQSVGFRL